MSMTKAADDFDSIAKRLREVEGEKLQAMGAKPTETHQDVVWTASGGQPVAFEAVPTGGSDWITLKIGDLPPYIPRK